MYVLPVRVYRAPRSFQLPEAAHYAGCRSWVELEEELPCDGATPALDDDAFHTLLGGLDTLLNPSAFA